MRQYLLSVYQPYGEGPPPDNLDEIMADTRAVSDEMGAPMALATAGAAVRSSRQSGPSRSPPEAGSGTGLTRTTICTGGWPP